MPPVIHSTHTPNARHILMKHPAFTPRHPAPAAQQPPLAACFGLAALLAAPLTPAAVTYATGDLLLGFHTASGVGSGTSFVLNLGPATDYKNNAYTTPLINDIGTVLSTTYGPGWYSRNDLYWGIAAVRDAAAGGPNTVVNGDPKATIYISKATDTPGASMPWSLASGSTVVSVATSIATMQGATGTDLSLSGGFEGAAEAADTGGRGVLQDEGVFINSWDEFNPIGGNAFGNILTGGVQGALGTGRPFAYLDLYRVIGRPSASANPNDPAGEGRYITTLTLNSAGIIGTVPEPTGALLLGLTGALALLRRRRP
jgi:hypothetical protein